MEFNRSVIAPSGGTGLGPTTVVARPANWQPVRPHARIGVRHGLMDALSDVLKVIRLDGAIYFDMQLGAPWCVASPPARTLIQMLHPGAERLMVYHFIIEGGCMAELPGQPPVQLVAGDIVVFPHGDAHLMGSDLATDRTPNLDAAALLRSGPRVAHGESGGAQTRLICGYLAFDPRMMQHILSTLPRVLTVNLRGGSQTDWLESSILYAAASSAAPEPGDKGVLSKLSEVLLVETMRRYIAQLAPGQTGWLAGLRDRVVGRCLALMHDDPARRWTVESLARESNTSRSVLAERFTYYVGQSPMGYLTRWRMALATSLLRSSSLTMMRVAEEVGYETDSAFSRAFRREFGMPPVAWRRAYASGQLAAKGDDTGEAGGA